MSQRNGQLRKDEYILNQNNIKLLNTNKYQSNSIIYTRLYSNKTKNNINFRLNKRKKDLNILNKYPKCLSSQSYINEQKTSLSNIKKYSYYKKKNNNNYKNDNISNNHTNNSTKNLRTKSDKRENKSKTKFYDYSNKLNDSIIKYKNKRNNYSNIKKNGSAKISSTFKKINYNPSFFTRTPKSSKSSKSSKRTQSSKTTKKYKMKIKNNKEEINDFSFIIHKNKINKYNYINKVSNNTYIKKEKKYYIHEPKSINTKKL